MIMLDSTHKRILTKWQTKVMALELELARLQRDWNDLVRRINKKGGEAFLETGRVGASVGLSEDEIAKLLRLCHPDKHDGRAIAVEMTQRLLELRK